MKNSTRLKSRYFTNFPRLPRHRVDRQRTRNSRWLCFKRDRSTVIHKSRACVHRLQNGRWCPLPVNKEKKGRKKKREKRKRKKKGTYRQDIGFCLRFLFGSRFFLETSDPSISVLFSKHHFQQHRHFHSKITNKS